MLKKQDLKETVETEHHHRGSTNLSWLWVRWSADTLVIGSVSERLDEYARVYPEVSVYTHTLRVYPLRMSIRGYSQLE